MKKRALFLAVSIFSLSVALHLPPQVAAANGNNTAGFVVTTSGNLNVRSGRSSSSARVGVLERGSYVTLIEKEGSWWKVEYADGAYGYAHADYIRPVSKTYERTVHTTSGRLNVRSGAGTSFPVQDKIASGDEVVVLVESKGWSRIVYDGNKTGYVLSSYLRSQEDMTDGQLYPAVSLKVADYKQTDSRWANKVLGNSGQTIRRIGCTTTAMAMLETYRTGKTIYPNTLADQMSYTSGGALYWPSDYVVSTNSNYLETIYARLREGKPVMIGAKTRSGGQHWVVVTGYTGGKELTPSKFTINDPGNGARTQLQQFFDIYPLFYKIAYYR